MGEWRPGTRVDDYVLDRQLGRGGMGVVFLATHAETGAQRVIKFLQDGQFEPRALARFRREGEAQARVDTHPNVVRVHAAGEAGGDLFLVLELESGGDLARRLEDGPLDPQEAAHIVRQLARGLAHAHARGVFHRDLKPSNVLFDEHGTPKLADFGLARLHDAGTLTRTGAVLGTPAYMAPEQASGAGASAAADVYGLGAVLYHALTGQPPYTGQTAINVLSRVLGDRSPVTPSELNPAVWPALDAVCLRALAKDPSARPASALELEAELARALEAPDSGRSRAPGIVAFAGIAALIALGVGLSAGKAPVAGSHTTAGTQPEPTTGQSPELSTVDSRRAARDLQKLQRELREATRPNGPALIAALRRWLSEHARHPDHEDARTALRQARRRFPVAIYSEVAGTFAFVSPTEALVTLPNTVQQVELLTGQRLRTWKREDPEAERLTLVARAQNGFFAHEIYPRADPKARWRGRLKRFDLASARSSVSYSTGAHVLAAVFLPQGRLLWSEFRVVGKLSGPGASEPSVWPDPGPRGFELAALSPSGKYLVVVSEEKKLSVWSLPTLEFVHRTRAELGVKSLAFVDDESYLVGTQSLTRAHQIPLGEHWEQVQLFRYRLRESRAAVRFEGADAFAVRAIAVTSDGTRAYTAGSEKVDKRLGAGAVVVWDLETQKTVGEPIPMEGAYGIALAPDGQTLLVGGLGGLEVWDVSGW